LPNTATPLKTVDVGRKIVAETFDLNPGKWFMCKKGHIYCISECDLETKIPQCPTCKTDIGK